VWRWRRDDRDDIARMTVTAREYRLRDEQLCDALAQLVDEHGVVAVARACDSVCRAVELETRGSR